MTITASRLGTSPITVDWSSLASVSAGTSLKGNSVDVEAIQTAWSRLKISFQQGDVGFYDAPVNNDLCRADESQALADEITREGKFTDCLFLGIGGSSLGPISWIGAMSEKTNPRLKFHFMENPDPVEWKTTVSRLTPATTLVCAITKSGTTFETVAQFLLALQWLGRELWKSNVVVITDPAKGDLRSFATREGLRTLPIAPSMGGRFSIFTPVGLFPAALAGLNIRNFLTGAKQVRDQIEKGPLEKNPLFILASELIRHSVKRDVHVCMPYSSRLRLLGTWFVQLWGESLGKDGKGFTPLAAVGATDQHSILQLLRDGPDDKITFFIAVDQVEDVVMIPKLAAGAGSAALPAFRILEGHSLHELLMIEYRATSQVLTRQGRPNLTIRMDRLDERALGALYFGFSVLTAVTGTMMGVNPFDQPGVEEGKVYIRDALNQNPES